MKHGGHLYSQQRQGILGYGDCTDQLKMASAKFIVRLCFSIGKQRATENLQSILSLYKLMHTCTYHPCTHTTHIHMQKQKQQFPKVEYPNRVLCTKVGKLILKCSTQTCKRFKTILKNKARGVVLPTSETMELQQSRQSGPGTKTDTGINGKN